MAAEALQEMAAARLGRTLRGKWTLDRVIGVGGMATVYAATHRNGARVAIKMLHPTVSVSETVRKRFLREGYLANKVDHPNVVRVLDDDVDETDSCAFLVMDLVVGRTLGERAIDRLLDEGELLSVAEQTLSALVAAHKQGIVHRDLKPDNLLVDEHGKVWVLDFGIARLLDDLTSSGTRTGASFGTPGFMAPEQALGKKTIVGERSDIYALGATLFALACGDFPHDAESPEELVVHTATREARSVGELSPELQPQVVGIIDRATRLSVDDRWPSARAMLEAVHAAQQVLGVSAVKLFPQPRAGCAPSVASHVAVLHAPSRAVGTVDSSGPSPVALPEGIAGLRPSQAPPPARKRSLLLVGGIAVMSFAIVGGIVLGARSRASDVGASHSNAAPLAPQPNTEPTSNAEPATIARAPRTTSTPSAALSSATTASAPAAPKPDGGPAPSSAKPAVAAIKPSSGVPTAPSSPPKPKGEVDIGY